MLDAIWAAFQPYVLELFKHKIDVTGKKNDWKRSSIGKFMALYDSMIELEGASESIYNEFLDIALHDGAVTRTIIRSRLEELSDSSKKFVEAARGVNNLLSIYNDDLVIQIRGVTSGKGRAWHDLELWLDALPTNTDSKGRAIPTIDYATTIPTHQSVLSLGVLLDFPTHNHIALDKDAEKVKRSVIKKVGKVRLDLHDKAAVAAQLNVLSKVIEEIRIVRSSLADFIRTSFPIDKIME